MPSFMVSQVALSGEAHVAVSEVALEGLLAIMDPHMREQVALFPEGLFTSFNLADKGSLSGLEK